MSDHVDLMAALRESLKDVRKRTAPDHPQHTQECLDEALMFHVATGGDADCICRDVLGLDAEVPSDG